MRSLIAPVIATASFATIVISCLGAASSITAPYRLHEFENLRSGIWTSGPVRIDRQSQTFERLAALPPAPTPSQTLKPVAIGIASGDQAVPDAVVATAAVGNEFCQRKYRSYRAEDNSYQPLNGGPRRPCVVQAPDDLSQDSQRGNPPTAVATDASPAHATWCQTRYSSYNAADDSYQPFGGGQRRTCMSPTTVASNG